MTRYPPGRHRGAHRLIDQENRPHPTAADTSLSPPVRRDPSEGAEHGRGLNIVDALSATWGWQLQDHGKAGYAILRWEG